MSKHLTTLSDHGYVAIDKVPAGRYTKTRLNLTDTGRDALGSHIAYLQSIAELSNTAGRARSSAPQGTKSRTGAEGA